MTAGPADTHCSLGEDAGGDVRQPTEVAACCGTLDAAKATTAAAAARTCDGGFAAGHRGRRDPAADSDYQPSMYGQQGSDDDCKYDVSWTSTPICKGVPVYFTVHVNIRAGATTFGGGAPLHGRRSLSPRSS